MRILTIDIETSPALVWAWGLFDQTISIGQIKEPSRVICFAAKWLDKPKVMFHSEFHDGPDNMVQAAYDLMSEADAIVHYNGDRFDIPHLNREFKLRKMAPPAPSKQIDLFKTSKRRFKWLSNKLDYVGQQLEIGAKVQHEGFPLWIGCLNRDEKAWNRMRRYNKQDVVLTEALYYEYLPWIPNHPSHAALTGKRVCPACGSDRLRSNGTRTTALGSYTRYQCQPCGKWAHVTKAVSRTDIVGTPDG